MAVEEFQSVKGKNLHTLMILNDCIVGQVEMNFLEQDSD